MTEEKVPGTDISKPAVQLSGRDGNAFAIMGQVSKALRRANVPESIIVEYLEDSKSGDYDHLLQVAMKYADVG